MPLLTIVQRSCMISESLASRAHFAAVGRFELAARLG
jgi:hypothetical protein